MHWIILPKFQVHERWMLLQALANERIMPLTKKELDLCEERTGPLWRDLLNVVYVRAQGKYSNCRSEANFFEARHKQRCVQSRFWDSVEAVYFKGQLVWQRARAVSVPVNINDKSMGIGLYRYMQKGEYTHFPCIVIGHSRNCVIGDWLYLYI